MFPISGATIKSAGSVIASARKMDLPLVCQPEKKEKAIKRTWNIIVAPVGKPSYVLQLIRQSGLPLIYEEFLQKMQLAGYEVRQGKHLSFRAPEQKNFTYMKSLGSYYSEENVRIRLAKNRNKVKTPKHLSREARLYINISTYVTTGNREGFEHWAKINNLKEAARTFNYLSENNLLNYEDFRQHVSDIEASVKVADQRIAQINSDLSTQKIIQKHCDSYRLCRKVIEDCKSAKNPKAYRTKHQAEYQLHDSLKKEFQDLGVTKIPSFNKIQKRIETLESEQTATVREKQELQKKLKTLEIIQQNFTALLNAPEIQIPVSEKEPTL